MRARSKSEIAMAAGMSSATMSRWFHSHREVMVSMGMKPTQKLLPPRAVKYVCDELGLHQEDFVA